MIISYLKRNFLAAMPVIGPHSCIEAELLLSGIKPVGFLPVYDEDFATSDLGLIKMYQDQKKLDEAVAEGKLISRDIQVKGGQDQPDYIMRHYAQPDKKEDMDRIADINEYWTKREDPPKELLSKGFARLLGYRRRDELLFNNYINLPDCFQDFIRLADAPCQVAYSEKMLRKAGIKDPEGYFASLAESLKQDPHYIPDQENSLG